MRLFRAPVLVADTETTGWPGQEWARVVELGAVLLDEQGVERGAFGSLVRPDILDGRAEPALAVNKIPRAELRGAPLPAFVVESFRAWHRKLDVWNPWTTTYNLGFDKPFFERMGLDGLRFAPCIMLRARKAMRGEGTEPSATRKGGTHGPGLARASVHFGIPANDGAHRAVADARQAAAVLCAIRRAEIGRAAAP